MPEPVFTILVVQRDEPAVQNFWPILRQTFQSSRIAFGNSVSGGTGLIEMVLNCGAIYDIALVDIRLPSKEGNPPRVDSTICGMLTNKIPETLIIHTDEDDENEAVNEHFEGERLLGKQVSFVCRGFEGWEQGVIGQMKEWLYGHPIEKQLDILFGPGGEEGEPCYRRNSLASDLAHLRQNIIDHWYDLSGDLQRRIRQHFCVESGFEGPVRISLLYLLI